MHAIGAQLHGQVGIVQQNGDTFILRQVAGAMLAMIVTRSAS